MFKIAVIVFRECLEIALLLGIIMAVTKRIPNSRLYILTGVMGGVVTASLFAFFVRRLTLIYSGMGDEMFDSAVILVTVILLIWTVIWMQGWSQKIKSGFGELSERIESGKVNYAMLALVSGATIFREATEIILFVYSIASVEKVSMDNYLLGLLIGSISGLIFGSMIYWGLIKVAGRYMFKISTILIILFAAGLASEAAGILTSCGIIEALSGQLWDSSWLISDQSISGKFFKTIFGYTSTPNGMQLVFYAVTVFTVMVLIKLRTVTIVRASEKEQV